MNQNFSALFEKVLVVEDDAGHTMLIKRALRDYCNQVIEAVSVSEGLTKLAKEEPELIITDLNLPDSDQTAHIGRFLDASMGAPIIVLTSSTLLRDAVQAMQLGARDYVVKEFGDNFREVLGLALTRIHTQIQLERDKLKLQREMEVLQIGIENSNDGLAVIDTTGQVRYANSAYKSFVRKCGGEIDNVFALFADPVNQAETIQANLTRNIQNLNPGAVWSTEVTFAEDRDTAFDLSLSMIKQPDGGEIEGFNEGVVWLRDISEHKRREKFQREILSTTTHDLKGPLGAIIVSSDLLREVKDDPNKVHELALRVGSSAHGAVNLIDEFLSARRIQEGTFVLKPTEQDLNNLLGEVMENYETIASARGIQLTYEPSEQPVSIHVDRLGFGRVVGNLLSNALKFTAKGGKVWLRLKPAKDSAVIEVEDTGSGMEPSDVQKIFGRFSRLEKHGDISGTGIGLFVVKSIVNAHGGKIDVTSMLGEGTRFDITFPSDPPVNERGELISLDFA